jgi:adenylate cyclase class 2
MYEVEVKAHLRDKTSVRKKLEDLGCVFSEELHQVDYIFAPEGESFPPAITTPVLRVRNQNKKYFFTLKISQSGRQDSIERELEIADGPMMMEIMKFIKYEKTSLVDKKRIKAKVGEIEVTLDDVIGLGDFIEAEKIVTHENPEDRKNVQQELCDFLETVGIAKEDMLVNHKYDIMLHEKHKGK